MKALKKINKIKALSDEEDKIDHIFIDMLKDVEKSIASSMGLPKAYWTVVAPAPDLPGVFQISVDHGSGESFSKEVKNLSE